MEVVRAELLPLRTSEDVVHVRTATRRCCLELGFSTVEQTKVVTASSELARNTVVHGGGGNAEVQLVSDGGRRGVQLVFTDQGPGIADVALALRDGYTTGSGMGLGLSGSKRLMNDLAIHTEVGKGTRVTAVRWK
jgi:serine/threonine-protein kinase RsbT